MAKRLQVCLRVCDADHVLALVSLGSLMLYEIAPWKLLLGRLSPLLMEEDGDGDEVWPPAAVLFFDGQYAPAAHIRRLVRWRLPRDHLQHAPLLALLKQLAGFMGALLEEERRMARAIPGLVVGLALTDLELTHGGGWITDSGVRLMGEEDEDNDNDNNDNNQDKDALYALYTPPPASG